MKEYFKSVFETDEKDYYCVWYADINSGFATEKDHVVCFSDPAVLEGYCRGKGISLSKETMIFNLSSLMEFAVGLTNDFVASEVLNFWNACSDLAFTLKLEFSGDDDNDALEELYDTLFIMGSEPGTELTEDDIADLREVIKDGCQLVTENLFAA
ncbi:MAG: hypothetical protein Q8882_02240 [Bacillota bacterium]|nr:hypothetical protein [Bacillota bacterium]